MMPAIYGNSYEIIQGPGVVAIRYEMVHDTRVIPLDGRKGLPGTMQAYMGDSRGHWEGDTLVVEGSHYLEKSAFGGASSALKTIERFRPTSKNTVDHLRRCVHVGEAVDLRHAPDPRRRAPDLRIRVPRGQRRTAGHPQRGARG
jgi:hypothetical protein